MSRTANTRIRPATTATSTAATTWPTAATRKSGELAAATTHAATDAATATHTTNTLVTTSSTITLPKTNHLVDVRIGILTTLHEVQQILADTSLLLTTTFGH